MGKIYYDEYGRPVRETGGMKNLLIGAVVVVIVLMFADSNGLINLSQYLPSEKPVVMVSEPTNVQQIQPEQPERVQPAAFQPTPNMAGTAVSEMTRTAPQVIQVIVPTDTPVTPTIVPTGISVEPETGVIIITDKNGYPVYAGPLNQDQYSQCKQIAADGDFWRLVDYQKPICMAVLQQ